jgi:GT2 family glycosyltransferase
MPMLMEALRSIKETTAPGEVDILVVDDCSPDETLKLALAQIQLKSQEIIRIDEPPFELHRKKVNSGFSQTVNVGLRIAREEERDAVLWNSDLVMQTPGWVAECQRTVDVDHVPAAVVGALLTYPNGLIQHAGINFSFLTRRFFERFKYGPGNLPAALTPVRLPVTGAFQYIRAETLTDVGIYDEHFKLGFEDVDYCVRVDKAGLPVIYNPNVRATHHESFTRGHKSEKVIAWEAESWQTFVGKYAGEGFQRFVPAVL